MSPFTTTRRRVVAGIVGTGLVASAGMAFAGRHELNEQWLKYQWRDRGYNAAVMEKALMIAGGNPTEAQSESREAVTIAEQFAQARTAPSGIVDSGAYGNAYSQISSLPSTAGTWHEVTKSPYNADDPRYRDWFSNSSGGAGYVTGRVTGLAADPGGKYVYAAGADGGVFRSSNATAAAKGSGPSWQAQSANPGWTPIADQLPSLSSGDLELAKDGSLWFATGEANTGGTSYVGAGVYRLGDPKTGSFSTGDQVGGQELQSTTIGRIRPGGDGKMWAATNRGIWYHSGSSDSGAWTFAFAPNMSWMPKITDDAGNVLVPEGSNCTDDIACGPTNAAYKNIVNDIAVDPKNPKHVVAAIGWRSGDTYNGFYETKDYTKGPSSWHKLAVTLGNIKNGSDVGYTTFAFSKAGDRLYALVQQPSKIASSSSLMGIYVSKTGSPLGPWNQIANEAQLHNSGSALDRKGYGVGVQAWYNQFLTVDPNNRDHVWAGLEEVFETTDAGRHWATPSPYWNFYFPCWSISDAKNTCPLAGHPDQHSVAVGGKNVFFGNDGGVYRRPVNGSLNANKNATDLVAMNDGTNSALQYYSVSVGKDTEHGGMVVSGGLQDNGVSNLFHVNPDGSNADPAGRMGSNFGGDGADGFADPRQGCNQIQEYVYLSLYVTNNCAQNPGATSEATATSRSLDPGDPNPRFIAPVGIDAGNPDAGIFGGQYVYTADKVWQAQDSSALKKVFDNGSGHSTTAVSMANGVAYTSWCGPCNNQGFTRGISTNAGGTWHQLTLPASFPNRFVQGLWADPADGMHAYAAVNGFSRRFTEGPGVGLGHLYETKDGGKTWTDVSANLPDVPASTVKQLPNGAVVVGTDLGAFYRAPGATDWQRLGSGLPLTVVMKLELGPDGVLYAATHGRGIWSITPPA
ncbi:WD40/YVTN/BNR-like repeat-containing protein [Phycicoccus flavus]|uniref:Glycosyl hydrolase n=1 Tax=Phycicoccus flavus TaxID=2502783 RepID=A0A8T6R8R5_9MICO|nr:glycosyl hydrolase [Phycicoccus flavus]NHA70094.1 glycosyl hydrolase [Phycicoccus flavus]